MNGLLNICGNGLSPLWDLFHRGAIPTAHAVGYSLSALRAYEIAASAARDSARQSFLGLRSPQSTGREAAELRQRVDHGVSGGLAGQPRKPRRGGRNLATHRT
jgi:hypothetical protein